MNETLHDALHRAAQDTGSAPVATGVELLRRARRRRSRHRILAGVAGATLVGAAAGTGLLILPADPGVQVIPAGQIAGNQVPGADRILAACSRAFDDADEEMTRDPKLFGPRAKVITADVSRQGTAAFILGSERKYYAECNLGTGPGQRWIHEYRADEPPGGGQNTLYGGGSFTYRDRFPADVARVRLDLYGGGFVTAPAVEGFVAFNRDTDSDGPSHITLYDSRGRVLADAGWGELPPAYDSLLPSARR